MCTVLLPPGGNPIAVKYIMSYLISYLIIYYVIYIISYHIISIIPTVFRENMLMLLQYLSLAAKQSELTSIRRWAKF